METPQLVTIPMFEYQRLLDGLKEISKLRAELADLDRYVEARFATVDRIEKMQSKHSERLGLLKEELDATYEQFSGDICNHGQRLVKLEQIQDKPQPRQLNQSEVLRALLAANGGKMLQSEAIKKMNITKSDFSRLLRSMKNDIKSKPYYKDRRKNLLELL